ncbi:MAG: TlpA disulfide reductase family protein [Saprospiraceae bacterium]|nr:TlpA disulfide reductase family protein [Saprospiraceae bacterium]
MKGFLLSVFLLLSVAASAQWTKLTSYDKYDEMAQEYMDRDDGYTYVINYWATWCGPCVKELTYFEQLLKAYSHDKTKVILVSLDFPNKVDSKLLPFLNKHNIQSEVVILDDPKSNIWIDKVDLSWEGAIPVTIIYRGQKRVFWDGEFDTYEDLDKLFLSIHN